MTLAVGQNRDDILNKLLEHGGNIDIPNKHGVLSATRGHAGLVDLGRSGSGFTPSEGKWS